LLPYLQERQFEEEFSQVWHKSEHREHYFCMGNNSKYPSWQEHKGEINLKEFGEHSKQFEEFVSQERHLRSH
jgi:hypothetical protein